jgi:hypothetical protein
MSEAHEFGRTQQSDMDAYQDNVRESRFEGGTPDWQGQYAGYIIDEQLECLTQHGVGSHLLLPRAWWQHMKAHAVMLLGQEPRPLQDKMADEMGDLLWFATDIEDRCDMSVTKACEQALERYVPGQVFNINGFEDLDKVVMENADAIRMPGRYASYDAAIESYTDYVSVVDHPALVYLRFGEQVTQALRVAERSQKEFGEVSSDELEKICNTTAELVLAMTYIAHDRLETDIETIADFNKEKLRNRREYGKENDINFSLFREAVEIYRDERNHA